MNARFKLAKHYRTHFFHMWNVYFITKYHYVRENTAYSKGFYMGYFYGFHQAYYVFIYQYIQKHREVGPLVLILSIPNSTNNRNTRGNWKNEKFCGNT